ncbi:transcriptional regulator [Psychrobacillus sp. FSL K6-4046]|uniref:transcriptional regulator n=1 Tax=unclassified Psychrobacillus TaxID=2636677 RepID=UPI00146A27EE|nr:transcriptional regulator [Psychrobacillus sp. MER TA 171]NME05478.1 transcriptional regulator [Psychrobacillus sp. BL-248-WT-3]
MRIIILKSMKANQLSEMIYMKHNGEISKRRVKVLSVSKDSFQAYCFLRGTKRIFKIENVLAFVPVLQKEREVI